MGWKRTARYLALIGVAGGGGALYFANHAPNTDIKLGAGGFIALITAWGVYKVLDSNRRNNSQDITQHLQNPQTPPNQPDRNNVNVHITYKDHSDRRSVHYREPY